MTEALVEQESRAEPWNDVDRFFSAVSARLFDPFGFEPTDGSDATLGTPRTDVQESPAAYTIAAELPGIPKEKLDIRVRGTTVEIRGENGTTTEKDGASYVYRERRHQGFYRRVELPEPVLAGQAKANVENGLLTLELPKEHPTTAPAEVKVSVA